MPDSTWVDWAVVSAIVLVGGVIFYRALKEPFDMLFGFIGRGFGAIRDKLSDGSDVGGHYDTIRYG